MQDIINRNHSLLPNYQRRLFGRPLVIHRVPAILLSLSPFFHFLFYCYYSYQLSYNYSSRNLIHSISNFLSLILLKEYYQHHPSLSPFCLLALTLSDFISSRPQAVFKLPIYY